MREGKEREAQILSEKTESKPAVTEQRERSFGNVGGAGELREVRGGEGREYCL
jgi:hypothetical protein